MLIRVFDENLKPEIKTEGKSLAFLCSSERGLCGAIHSYVAKQSTKIDGQIIILGDKAKPQTIRLSKSKISMSFNNISKNVPSYEEVSAVADLVLKEHQFENVQIVFNKFVSVISYETTIIKVPTKAQFSASKNICAYEMENDALNNYFEFNTAVNLYSSLVEGFASEMSSRRTAMENATKNAQEVIGKLTMQYNRTRQAVITNELVDIITGASAL